MGKPIGQVLREYALQQERDRFVDEGLLIWEKYAGQPATEYTMHKIRAEFAELRAFYLRRTGVDPGSIVLKRPEGERQWQLEYLPPLGRPYTPTIET